MNTVIPKNKLSLHKLLRDDCVSGLHSVKVQLVSGLVGDCLSFGL